MDSSRTSAHRTVKANRISPERFALVQFFLFAVLLTLLFQTAQLSIFYRSSLVERAASQHRLVIDIPPIRGSIQDRNGQGLAVNLTVPSIYAVPRLLTQKEKSKLVSELSHTLSLSPDFIQERLNRNKSFVWLKRRASIEEAKKVGALENSALGILQEHRRFYPHGQLLANVLGFTDVDNRGIEGIERTQEVELRGKAGKRYSRRDAFGREIKAFEEKTIPSVDGHRLVLTIDRYLQYVTERALERSYRQWKAKGAAAILMNPETGEILAMATRPTFDPNQPGNFSSENHRNRAVTDMFEPGSVFKIVAATGLLGEHRVKMTEKINCESGAWTYGIKTLHDVHEYGSLTFPEVIVKSSNIGTAKLASRLSPSTFYGYMQIFGFGSKTGIDLEGESPGFIRPPNQWSKTSPYAIPIGQEVTVTALQLARAISLIANGGHLVEPYLIDRVEDVHGVTLRKHEIIRSEVKIPAPIIEVLKEILWRATEEGTGKMARVKGITVAGKTGTAQKISGKGYSHSNFIGSFIGFAPADHPLLSMVVVIDDPHPSYYGGTVAAPVFSEVMEAALAHLGYSPP